MVKRIRNRACQPYLSTEGVIAKPLPALRVTKKKGVSWYSGLTPFERVFAHQTLASMRRYAHFKPFSGLIPVDELDFVLASPYNHSYDSFPYPGDPYLQLETLGVNTWRRLRNSRDIQPERDAKGSDAGLLLLGEATERYNDSHPVLIGGITEREHPSHVKLMNSSHHSPQTNAGYSRQDKDGTFFQY